MEEGLTKVVEASRKVDKESVPVVEEPIVASLIELLKRGTREEHVEMANNALIGLRKVAGGRATRMLGACT